MIVGDWSFALPPMPDELLSSLLARNACEHGLSPYRFLEMLWPGRPVWNRDIDRDPPPEWLDEVAARSGLAPAAVARTSLADVRRVLARAGRAAPGDTPLLLSAGIFHRKRRRHGLQYCPSCLVEGEPFYRRRWRLGFMLACERHGTALRDACPRCDSPLAPHRVDGSDVGTCQSCLEPLGGETGAAGVLPGALALQGGLLAALAGREAAVGPWSAADCFAGVRSLAGVMRDSGVLEALRTRFSLAPREFAGGRFEHARWAERRTLLETAATWSEDWPRSFREGAAAAGLTRRSFARQALPRTLADEVARLPPGFTRDRRFKPVLQDRELKRLRRRDPTAYAGERAARLLAAAAR